MRFCNRNCWLWIVLWIAGSGLCFGQGFLDFSSNAATFWSPDGALQQSYSNLGSSLPPVTVSITVDGTTRRFINNTPRNDSRGLWLNLNLSSPTEEVKLTFVFSDPLINLSLGIKGVDRDVRFGNFQDRVAIEAFDNQGAPVTPSIRFNPSFAFLTNGTPSNVRVLSGFNSDDFDTTLSVVRFGGMGVKRMTLVFGTGTELGPSGLTPQSIFLTSLAWSNIVPVQLLYLRGKANGSQNQLTWATATELNSDYFSVQRSVDLREFSDMGRVKSAGDSRQRLEYSFTDETPLPGVNYYRLKQVDKDGSSEYSKIIAVNAQSTERFVVYPNPSDGQSINLQFDNLSLEGLGLVDLLGQKIPFVVSASSSNSLSIKPSRTLQTGLYFVTYAAANEPRFTQKLWVQP